MLNENLGGIILCGTQYVKWKSRWYHPKWHPMLNENLGGILGGTQC
jgi:hypothetical protein